MNSPLLDQALAVLKRRIIADAEYAIDHSMRATSVLDGFEDSDLQELVQPLYEAAIADVNNQLEVRS